MTEMSKSRNHQTNQYDCSTLHPASHTEAKQTVFQQEKSLSKKIKNARIENGMSQREFAKVLGITQAQLCRLETKPETRPTKKTLKALAPYIGEPYSDLLVQMGYCGVVSPTEEFPNKSGEYINAITIMEEIYRTDSDFFKYLDGISQYGTKDNLAVLKAMIAMMKLTEKQNPCNTHDTVNHSFQCLKDYILKLLSLPVSV